LIIANKEVPIATYHLSNLGIRRLEQEISKVFKVDKHQALKMIHNPKPSEIQIAKPLFVKYLEKLSEEILVKLDAVKNKYGIIPEVLYLIGGGARIPNINQILAQVLEIPYQRIEIQQKIKINDNIHPDYLEIINTQGVLALATAVKELL
jgi:type IV pilus assembly protein PilM